MRAAVAAAAAAECGEILIYLIANVATDTVTSRGRPALYHQLTLPQLRNPP